MWVEAPSIHRLKVWVLFFCVFICEIRMMVLTPMFLAELLERMHEITHLCEDIEVKRMKHMLEEAGIFCCNKMPSGL